MRNFVTSLLCLSLAATSMARDPKWCFVVAGDGRADSRTKRAEDKDGINTLITAEIGKAVVKEKAKFLMWTGDLCLGYTKTPEEFETMLTTWRGLMEPLYSRNIPVLACRGNHEAGAADSANVWRKVFSGPYQMPQNGPDSESDLSWFYGKGDVLAIGLDQYTTGQEMVHQDWLDGVLKRYPKKFVFCMGHEPAFMDGAHKDTMDAHPEARDIFWNALINAGSRVFFAGHDHLYDHMVIRRDGPDKGPEMHQIVAGTSGAPFYKSGIYAGKNQGWVLERRKAIENTYGYLVVTIDGRRATVTFKGRKSPGVYEAMDTFSYVSPVR
ncbi:MAG: metallophosphoesterase [Armatimonadetes bacterium]|nr:metallophosphoesterase [Armatimonadota bacterium]